MGVVASAADLYEALGMWDEVVECYKVLVRGVGGGVWVCVCADISVVGMVNLCACSLAPRIHSPTTPRLPHTHTTTTPEKKTGPHRPRGGAGAGAAGGAGDGRHVGRAGGFDAGKNMLLPFWGIVVDLHLYDICNNMDPFNETHQDSACYEKAWAVSKGRYPRAKRSLGRVAFRAQRCVAWICVSMGVGGQIVLVVCGRISYPPPPPSHQTHQPKIIVAGSRRPSST